MTKKKDRARATRPNIIYNSPPWMVWAFYGLLIAWTLVSVVMLGRRAVAADWSSLGQWAMIAFVVAYTWFFSVGIFYRAGLDQDDQLVLWSLRRVVRIDPMEMPLVEGPHIAWGFVRFRLPREKGYLFACTGDDDLHRLLWRLRGLNPELKLKHIEIRLVRG